MKTLPPKLRGILFSLLLFPGLSFSQGLYLGFHAGYGIEMASQNIQGSFLVNADAENFISIDEVQGEIQFDQQKFSLGKGINFGGRVGYSFQENFGVEMEVSYLRGATTSSQNFSIRSIHSNMLRLIPKILISPGFENLNPYISLGLVLGKGSISYTSESSLPEAKLNLEMKGGWAIGTSAAIGANVNLNQKLSLFGELKAIGMSYSPNEGKLKEAMTGGTDILPNLSIAEKEFRYVEGNPNTSTPNPDSDPSKLQKTYFPFSSIGLEIGLKLGL